MKPWKRWLGVISAVTLLGMFIACGGNPSESRWATVQQESRNKPAVSKEALEGSAFNKFFPKAKDQFDLTFKQEKKGFAQASLKKDGKEVALLSVSDTISEPDATEKYKETKEELAGYPMAAIGTKATGLLVGNRFQVQVRSMDESFGKDDREEWLKKFDLDGIAKLD
jgi:hypothetical protein